MKKNSIALWILFVFAAVSGYSTSFAPVSTIGIKTEAGLTATVPITATGYSNIGAWGLKISYDPAVVTVSSVTQGPNIFGYLDVNLLNSGLIFLSYAVSPGENIIDGAVVVNINFSKKKSGTSALAFIDDGTSCAWYDGSGTLLTDTPLADFYHNGSVTFLSLPAPVTIAPVMSACPGSVIHIPITVTGFTNIGSLSLTMNYNSSVLTYINYTNTSGFPGLTVNGAIAGKIVAGGYSSSSGKTYSDNTTLFTLNFTYSGSGGSTALTWFDSGHSCEYADYPGYTTLVDIPFGTYYQNGQMGPLLGVDFTADNLLPAVNQTVIFTDLTAGGPASWAWSIAPETYVYVNGTSAVSQNPNIQFTSNGPYQVSLSATKNTCAFTRSRSDFIHSGTKGLWTGISSEAWNTPSNWNNYMVPESTIDVVIPSSSTNWPVFNGDLIIGAQCKSLTVEGTSTVLTITGDLIINQTP